MLMALESGEIAAHTVARWLDSSGASPSSGGLANDYRLRYAERFNARLRVCSVLRRAAFVPRLAEAMMLALGASAGARRSLARATRRSSIGLPGEGPATLKPLSVPPAAAGASQVATEPARCRRRH
jgi:hypothetical protein